MEKLFLKAFKELGQFLGGKLDLVLEALRERGQSIRIDMGDATKRMEETASAATQLMEAMDSFIDDEKLSREQTLSIISAVQRTVEAQSKALESQDSIPRLLEIAKELRIQTDEIRRNKVDIKPDSKLHALVKEAIGAIYDIPKPDKIDLKPLEKAIKDIKIETQEVSIDLTPLADLMKLLLKKFDELKTIKIDDSQYRGLRNSGGSIATVGAPLAARNVTTVNVALTASNTEYSYTFPANTTMWELKLRDQGVLMYYAFVAGKMPAGGDSSNYVTVPQNFVKSRENVDWSGKTIYIGAESNSQVAELTIYTA